MYQTQQQQYEKCPKHQQNDIILFCQGGNCMEPLCKECCKIHVQWHNQNGSKIEMETIDNLRQNCIDGITSLKLKFQEERAILHHFKDEGQGFIQTIHHKLEKVKLNLQRMIDEYLLSLEKQVAEKVKAHQLSHPTENRVLYEKLEKSIQNLESQERALQQPKYIRALLTVVTEGRNHDLEMLSNEIDNSVKQYLKNMFDIFVHEDHLNELKLSLHHYVAVEPANLEEEIEVYAQKLREGKKVFGIEQSKLYQQPPQQNYQTKSQAPSSKQYSQSLNQGSGMKWGAQTTSGIVESQQGKRQYY